MSLSRCGLHVGSLHAGALHRGALTDRSLASAFWPASPYLFLHASDPAGVGNRNDIRNGGDETGFTDGVDIDGTPAFASGGSDGATFDEVDGSFIPTWEDNATYRINGEPVVRLENQEVLKSSLAASSYRFLHDGTTDYTIYLISKQIADGVRTVHFSTAGISGTSTGMWARWADNGGAGAVDDFRVEIPTASGTYLHQVGSNTSPFTRNVPHIVKIMKTSGTLEAWVDGTSIGSQAEQTTPDTGDPTHTLRVGGSNVWWEEVHMAGLAIYKRALSAADQALFEASANTLWGV